MGWASRVGRREATIQRLLIMGGPGCGKSRLALEVGERLDLKVVHLDVFNFYPDWIETETAVFRAAVQVAISDDRWVTDGNYFGKTADIRLARADGVIWIDQPRWLRLLRILRRSLFTPRYGRPDMAKGCRERLDWGFLEYAWTFDKRKRASILERVQAMSPLTPIVYLRGDRGIRGFLQSLSREMDRKGQAG